MPRRLDPMENCNVKAHEELFAISNAMYVSLFSVASFLGPATSRLCKRLQFGKVLPTHIYFVHTSSGVQTVSS